MSTMLVFPLPGACDVDSVVNTRVSGSQNEALGSEKVRPAPHDGIFLSYEQMQSPDWGVRDVSYGNRFGVDFHPVPDCNNDGKPELAILRGFSDSSPVAVSLFSLVGANGLEIARLPVTVSEAYDLDLIGSVETRQGFALFLLIGSENTICRYSITLDHESGGAQGILIERKCAQFGNIAPPSLLVSPGGKETQLITAYRAPKELFHTRLSTFDFDLEYLGSTEPLFPSATITDLTALADETQAGSSLAGSAINGEIALLSPDRSVKRKIMQKRPGLDLTRILSIADAKDEGLSEALCLLHSTREDESEARGTASLLIEHGSELWEFSPETKYPYWFGADACTLSDLNGDGIRDLAVGSPGNGLVYLICGKSGTAISQIRSDIEKNYLALEHFGAKVAEIHDITDDGRPELAIGTSCFGGRSSRPGRVLVVDLARERVIRALISSD